MRQRYEIFESLKSSFLVTQNSISDIVPGSIINSLLYANSVELSLAFSEIDAFKNSLYIDRASGINLDFLITGFTKLTRTSAKSSIGYVLVELSTPITEDNLDLLNFSFAQYASTGDVIANYQNVVTFPVNNTIGSSSSFALVNPLNFNFAETDFNLVTVNNIQPVLASYKEYLKVLYRQYKKPIKYLVLPIAAIDTGAFTNLPSGNIQLSINLGGLSALISNPFTFPAEARKAYLYLKDATTVTDVIMADIDGIVNGGNGAYGLENFSYISGGSDLETDESYRSRFYSYLNSLSKGTVESISFAISNEFPNFSFSLVETSSLGSLDVYVDTNYVLSKPTLQRIQNSINSVKPAGIKINVKPTKNVFVSILADVESSSFKQSVDTLRSDLFDFINTKDLGETLSYEDLIFSSTSTVDKKDNMYYGEFLNASLFNMYKEVFQKTYAKFGIKNSLADSSSTYWKSTTYYDVYDQITTKPSTIYLAYAGCNLKYPLIGLVKKALSMSEAEKAAANLNNTELEIVNTIQSVCTTVKPSQCLAKIIPGANSFNEDSSSILETTKTIPAGIAINLQNIANIVSNEYANYYKVKLMTIPFVKKERSENAIPAIVKTLSTDVIYLTYDDLTEVSLDALEKVKLMRDFSFTDAVYEDSSVVGARPLER